MFCLSPVCRPGLHENPRRGPLAQVPENEQEHEEEDFGVLMEYVGEEQQGHVEGHVGEAMNGFDFMEEQRQEEENVGEAMIDFDMREDHRHEEEHLGALIEYFGEEEQRHIEEHVGEAVFGFDMRDEQEDEEEHLGALIEFFGEEEQQHEEEHFGVMIEDFGEEEQVPEEENADEAMIGFDLREEQEHEEEHFGLLIEDLMEEEQALDERIVLENAENDGGNGNPDYRNEHRSIFMELPHSSSEAGKSFVMGHHQESLGNCKDLPQEAMRRTQQNLTDEEPGSSSSCSRQDRNPGIPEQYNASTMSCPDASTPPQNDPTQNGPVSENHLEVSNNVEAHSSIDAGPSEGHSSSSPETQSNSRKRKRKSNFPSSSCNSPETDDNASTMPRPDASTPPQNDPNGNDPVPGNHLEVSKNVEAHSSIDAGPSEGHSSSSLETQNNSFTMPRSNASTLPQNDLIQNVPVPGNHLEVSNNAEAHSSNAAGPSGGQSSSSLETQSTSRKRNRKSNFNFNSPETHDSLSKRRLFH
ncbi:cilia- and flagella-associated protein 251-like [Pygocentrus nattereri]|uniref:cilia- and flagella-associated protein 251-like n=1 Tax=Pygocentrus nattereri TaxID=42514 RepID=UPI0008145DC0|nr:cilia- and flagella-associated protein 251-like [Pygocentrus nattereri]